MLHKLTVKNFQRHKAFTVEFDPKVTLITGETDAGKSALIRALAFVCLGKWDPCFVRHGSKAVEVILEGDEFVLFRKKGQGVNQFRMNKKEFAAFGNKIPEEIADLLKLGPDNFQLQLDSHFWFGDTSGEVSKKLNRIVNLEIIDQTIQNLNSELRTAKTRLQVSEERLSAAQEQVEKTKWVDDFRRRLKRLKELKNQKDVLTSSVRSAGRAIESARESAKRARAALIASNAFGRVRQLRTRHRAARANRERLASLVSELSACADSCLYEPGAFDPVLKMRAAGDRLAERRRTLERLIQDVKQKEDRQWEINKKVESAQKELKKASLGVVCPKCGQTVKVKPTDTRTRYSSPTCTSPTKHRSPGPKKKTGTKSSSGG